MDPYIVYGLHGSMTICSICTVKTAVLFWHKIGHIWYYVTKKNREKQEDGTKFDPLWSPCICSIYGLHMFIAIKLTLID